MIKLTFEFDSKQAFVDFVKSLPDTELPPSQVTGAPEVVPAAEPEKAARKPRASKLVTTTTTSPAPAPQVTDSEREAVATPAKVDPTAFVPPLGPTFTKTVAPATEVPTQAPLEQAPPVSAPAVAAPTQAEAQAAVERVFEAKGFQGAHQLLAQFGSARLRELPAEKYAEFIAYADKMVA